MGFENLHEKIKNYEILHKEILEKIPEYDADGEKK